MVCMGLPTPVLWPGKFHGWRSLVGYSPWGCKESDTTERLHSLVHSLVAASGGYSPLWCSGFSLWRLLSLRSTGSRHQGSRSCGTGLSSWGSQSIEQGSIAGAPWLHCSAACGVFPDQGSNPCLLHWRVDCSPLVPPGKPQSAVSPPAGRGSRVNRIPQVWCRRKYQAVFTL